MSSQSLFQEKVFFRSF